MIKNEKEVSLLLKKLKISSVPGLIVNQSMQVLVQVLQEGWVEGLSKDVQGEVHGSLRRGHCGAVWRCALA